MIKVNINGYEEVIQPNKFPDGTFLLRFNVEKDFVEYREGTITWLYEKEEELVTLIYITEHLKNHGVMSLYLNMPYIPNARMDRQKGDEDVFTLKYFADVINWLDFDSVRVLDPHSSVSEALIDRLIVDSSAKYIESAWEEIDLLHPKHAVTLFYPDEGSRKRYSDMFVAPCCFGMKKRDWQTGEIYGLDVIGDEDLIKGKIVLIVDDLCSKGGTFYHSAKKLKELGAEKIYLYVTHCENTILQGEILKSDLIERVFTTNSVFTEEHEKITVMEVEYDE